jgi:hypothetical protein
VKAVDVFVNGKCLFYETSNPRLLIAVIRRQPVNVVAGFESGVELAERLANELGLPCQWHNCA